jgi:hypothetical protein
VKTHPKRFDDAKRFDEVRRCNALSRAAACVVALALCALAAGCLTQSAPAPSSGGASNAKPEASAASPTPAPAADAAPSPAAESPLPRPEGFVNDFAEVIDDITQASLESKFRVLRANSKIEFAVVTVETTGDRDIFDYSLAVARGWGVGPPAGEGGGGLLLLFAVKDRKWRLQVSRDLEADLPDDVAGELAAVMTPLLRAGNFGGAADAYADALIGRLAARRGFSMKHDELIIRGLPSDDAKAAGTPEPPPRGKR